MKKFFTLMMAVAVAISTVNIMAQSNDQDVNKSVRAHYGVNGPEKRGDSEKKENDKNDKKDKKNKKRQKPQAMDPEQYSAEVAAEQARRDSIEAVRKAEIEALLAVDYDHEVIPELIPFAWKNDTVLTPVDELAPLFRVNELENGDKLYVYNGQTLFFKENDLVLYFKVKDGVPEPMRMRVNFYADDPLDFTRLDFMIDGFSYSYTPDKIEKGKDGTKFFFENFDDEGNDRNKDIMYALAHAEYFCDMTYISNLGVNHRIRLTPIQLKKYHEVYEMYRALGGTL